MPATLSTPPAAPSRTNDTPSEFVVNADAFMAYIEGLSAELNPWATSIEAMVSGVDFNGTSTSSVAIGTGSKSWTTQSGKLWQVGQFVIVADSATPANYCYGQVTGYSPTTLDVDVTATGGSGTKTAWAIGLAPNASSYATKAGTETLSGKTVDLASNTLTGTTAQFNAALSDGDFATKAGTETLSGKTLEDPILSKALVETAYTITDGAAFEIDPSSGTVQKITLGASRTPKATNFANGESILLLIDDGTAYAITWTDATWGGSGVKWIGSSSGGGVAPALGTTGLTWVLLTKYSGQVYGQLAGYSG